MGRGRNKRNRNKSNNRNRNKSNNKRRGSVHDKISGATTLKFLKRDSDVGLFMDADGSKYRVHKEHIYGTLGWVTKGARIAVKTAKMIPVTNQRLIVTNTPDWFGVKDENQTEIDFNKQPTEEPYMYESDIQVITSDSDVAYFGIPKGTQYHWLAFKETPRVGDFVMVNYASSVGGTFYGVVKTVDKKSRSCSVKEYKTETIHMNISTYDIGFIVINPDYLKSFKFANA